MNGVCACPSGRSSCSRICRNLATDSTNCGSCGNACAAGQLCSSGACQDGSGGSGGTDGFGGAANRVAMIASACASECEAEESSLHYQCPPPADCITSVCEDPVAPGAVVPTPPGCEDPYVTMTLCLGGIGQWTCSDWGTGASYPAPAAGTACEAAICAWTCCDYQRGGILWDANVLGRCAC
jgi:hypothetical protein